MFPKKLQAKLETRHNENATRQLGTTERLIDFSSNDYLGFAGSEALYTKTLDYLDRQDIKMNGASGSRLLTGNHPLYTDVEKLVASYHKCESALIFNSGYDANIGFFSAVPQRGDIILYDELSHASIRDGIRLSQAQSYKFKHNDLVHLEKMLQLHGRNSVIYVVTETVFSMDGDTPDLTRLNDICSEYKAYLILDEAHATGVLLDTTDHLNCFARIVTFGKALGVHGAAILSSLTLRTYLINFSRSLIYTTALTPHTLATIRCAYDMLEDEDHRKTLQQNIAFFRSEIKRLKIDHVFIPSESAIHCCILECNERVKTVSNALQKKGYDVRPILSPTVMLGTERLRFCIHSYNSEEEISKVLTLLATFVA